MPSDVLADVLQAPARAHPLWKPKRLLITPSALSWPQGATMAERAAALGAEVVRLKADRLTGLPDTYRDAKTIMETDIWVKYQESVQSAPA